MKFGVRWQKINIVHVDWNVMKTEECVCLRESWAADSIIAKDLGNLSHGELRIWNNGYLHLLIRQSFQPLTRAIHWEEHKRMNWWWVMLMLYTQFRRCLLVGYQRLLNSLPKEANMVERIPRMFAEGTHPSKWCTTDH